MSNKNFPLCLSINSKKTLIIGDVNPRLYPIRIDNADDFPLIREDTCILWYWDPIILVNTSEFYKHLISNLESMKDLDQTKCWILWNQIINTFMLNNSK